MPSASTVRMPSSMWSNSSRMSRVRVATSRSNALWCARSSETSRHWYARPARAGPSLWRMGITLTSSTTSPPAPPRLHSPCQNAPGAGSGKSPRSNAGTRSSMRRAGAPARRSASSGNCRRAAGLNRWIVPSGSVMSTASWLVSITREYSAISCR